MDENDVLHSQQLSEINEVSHVLYNDVQNNQEFATL